VDETIASRISTILIPQDGVAGIGTFYAFDQFQAKPGERAVGCGPTTGE